MATNQNTNVYKEEANNSLVPSLPTLVYSYPYSPLFPNKQKNVYVFIALSLNFLLKWD